MCVCVCVCVYTYIKLHTHAHPYTQSPSIHRIAQEYGLIAIPTSAFYGSAHQPSLPPSTPPMDAAAAGAAASAAAAGTGSITEQQHAQKGQQQGGPVSSSKTGQGQWQQGERRPLVRFTFCKTDATLEAAAEVFRRLGRDQQQLRRQQQQRGGGEGKG